MSHAPVTNPTAPVTVTLTNGPLKKGISPFSVQKRTAKKGISTFSAAESPDGGGDAGAVLCFEGIVRPTEGGQPVVALDYEAYEPMADAQLRRLANEIVERHRLLGLWVEHSRGRVAAGECSFRLRVASRHRPEALRAVGEFIDRMKRDVPIWKTPVFE